jgi:hypothetical protein
VNQDEKRAQRPDGMPVQAPVTPDGDVADVTAHSAAGPRAMTRQDRPGWFIDPRDLHELAIKWSLIHGPGVLPGATRLTCARRAS